MAYRRNRKEFSRDVLRAARCDGHIYARITFLSVRREQFGSVRNGARVQLDAEKWQARAMRTAVDDDGSEFDPLAGRRLDIQEPFGLLEGDWVEARGSSIRSVVLNARADEAQVLLVDGQMFTFYDDEHLVVYRQTSTAR